MAEQLCRPLAILFRKSLDESVLPDGWKTGHITPIHKKGSHRLAGNYRPVSLTAVLAKILESLVRDAIVDHMTQNALFADEQHGFVPGRSCMTQLLLVMEDWTLRLENNSPFDVAYLDFKKAFDSVPHLRLINKLKSHGIEGKVLHWIQNFLSNRKQRVVVGKEKSDWADVVSGIPQGSVLGPILFVIYINDLPSVISSTAKLFADDTKVYSEIKTEADRAILQSDLQALEDWSTKWQLPFNADKCKIMHIGNNNPGYGYTMGGHPLDTISKEKDLGVHIDNQLKFHDHTATAVSKANQILAVIRSSFENLDDDMLPRLYKTLVRPHLEYGNLIWGPHYRLDQQAVERVQRRATKLVPNLKDRPYIERLQALKLPSLLHRRRRGDMIQVYKIVNNKERIETSELFSLNTSTATRGHNWKLFKPVAQKDARIHTFSVRVINNWNNLPETVVNADSVNTFKNRLDAHWMDEQYTLPTYN